MVVAAADGFDLISAQGRHHLAGPRPYRWAAAYSIPAINTFVVPTDVGVSVFVVTATAAGPVAVEHFHPCPGTVASTAAGATAPIVTMPDARGILAFSPWGGPKPGGTGVCRFVDGQWVDLPAANWPARLMVVSVLLDGSVLQIAAPPVAAPEALDADTTTAPAANAPTANVLADDHVQLSIAQLDPAKVDTTQVDPLVAQLSDPDPDKRQAAFDQLARYGPALFPVLERARGGQPAAAQLRLDQLLRSKVAPALGGMMLIGDRLAVAARQADGTAVLFAPAGVQLPTEGADETVVPAWFDVRPDGRIDRPLPPALVADQRPDACTLRLVGDDWLVVDAAGPRRFFGNAFVPLLTPPEAKRFTTVVGLAARHRWVFADPANGQSLIVDPTIADPTPRLPTWTIAAGTGRVGWDDRGDPVVQRGPPLGQPPAPPPPAGTVVHTKFLLTADDWQPLADTDPMRTELPPIPPPPATRPATTTSTTASATMASTTAPADDVILLRTADGTRYADGRSAIVTVTPTGRRTRWPLPPEAAGDADTVPVLMRTDDGLLFLYNAPGRLLRLRPATDGTFAVEATFTKGIPDEDVARVWLDPAGRIDFAVAGDRPALTVTFPAGRVPKAIADMMPNEAK